MSYEIINKQKKQTVKGVLFDMDGVVLDTEKLYTRFWMEAAIKSGYPMTWEQSLGMRSLNHIYGQQYLEKCFGKGISYMDIREVRIELMNAWIDEHGVDVKKGVYELLNFLNERNIPCAITTSSPIYRVEKYLKPLGIYDKFNAICSGYEVEKGKPEPDIYLYGALKINIDPANCLALEDSPSGILSAYRAGCMPVIIPDLDKPTSDVLSMCYAKVESLKDVDKIITYILPDYCRDK